MVNGIECDITAHVYIYLEVSRGRDRMVVGFTTSRAITAKVVSSNPTHGEMYSIQHYEIYILHENE
jgi:hypothetical protein